MPMTRVVDSHSQRHSREMGDADFLAKGDVLANAFLQTVAREGTGSILVEGSAGVGVAVTGLAFGFISFSFSGRGFGATGRPQHTLLCRADMARGSSRGPLAWRTLGPSKIKPGQVLANSGDSRRRRRSPGPC